MEETYYAYQLNGQAKYGINKVNEFKEFLEKKFSKTVSEKFSESTWSYDEEKNGKGLTHSSLRAAKMMSTYEDKKTAVENAI